MGDTASETSAYERIEGYTVSDGDGLPCRVNLLTAAEQIPEYLRLLEGVRIARRAVDSYVTSNPGVKGLLEYIGDES